ncbi:putative Xre family transcriptional regulator [Selenomonas ruminantium subsp. lactilytica TAM6421]|uniref:Putative Xre family transcriptional regulator n=1 Tax=Selenomonas ruminantium subsp. lactilytica (strain NBRC 103574 / TAM6421) TaxID=927704 RepID=I0GMM2_SELRL|nr:helix-turn-helix transcriptional regulator [Selenomonas ruminantium]BAL82009.1 putative Xre family transcriptional regulator [Selenomonas ruminantium subsp. lactilytica TAM6421]
MSITGQRLRLLREEKQWSQEVVARKIGISRTAYNKYESGVIQPVRKIKELAGIFGVSADYILGSADNVSSVGDAVPKVHRQMRKYMDLSDNGREIVDITLDAVYEREERKSMLPSGDM